MLLTADIGNTVTTFAILDGGGKVAARAAFSTDAHATADQYAVQLFSLFQLRQVDHNQITGAILSSVVPSATAALSRAVEELTGRTPLVVGAGIRTGLNIRSDLHAQLGADIVACCVGAMAKYPQPIVVIDFGTAVTFSVLRGGVYEGCVIAPGVRVSLDALSSQAAELPHISLSKPDALLGRNTVDAMRAGAVYGGAGMVDGILDRLEDAGGPAATVVATGPYVGDVTPCCRRPIVQDGDLLLEGLWLIYQKNSREPGRGRG